MFGLKRRGADVTVIAAGAALEGSVRSEGAIVVDGRVLGTVESERSVEVGPGGSVEGDIKADDVTVGGRVQGTVVAAARLRMRGTGCVQGDARYGSLEVDRGGLIQGRAMPIAGLGLPAALPALDPAPAPAEPLLELTTEPTEPTEPEPAPAGGPPSPVSTPRPLPPLGARRPSTPPPAPRVTTDPQASSTLGPATDTPSPATRDSAPPPAPTPPAPSNGTGRFRPLGAHADKPARTTDV